MVLQTKSTVEYGLKQMMSSKLSSEDVVQLTSPRVLTSGSLCVPSGSASGGRAIGTPGGVELGRKLLLAARAGDTDLVLELMAAGAPFTTDWLGTSALHLAAANDHADTCSVLLRAGVSRDARTKVERTPLHLAAHAGHERVVTLLLSHGAPPDCRDMLRMTPLHWAAARGHEAVACELLRAGADISLRCKFRLRPRDLALRRGHDALVALLTRFEMDADTEPLVTETKPLPEDIKKIPMQEIKSPIKSSKLPEEKTTGIEIKNKCSAAAAALLRRHGITMLPADTGSTLLTALQSGRTVGLSDAGKLLLKECASATSNVRRTPLKIVLNRNNLTRLVAVKPHTKATPTRTTMIARPDNSTSDVGSIVRVKLEESESDKGCGEQCTARKELVALRAALSSLTEQLALTQSRLAALEGT